MPAHPVLEGDVPATHLGKEEQENAVKGKARAKVGSGTSYSSVFSL